MTNIFGHRGAAGTYPENTMVSFEAAYKAGADGIELDVQMTKDGTLVVIHDEKVNRTTNGTGFVKDFTYNELQHLDASYKFKKLWKKIRIPTLEEVLAWGENKKGFLINIELKNGIIDYPEIEKSTIKAIEQHGLKENVIISSFNHNSLVKCKNIAPEIVTAALYMEGLYKPWNYAKEIRAEGIHPQFRATPKEVIDSAQAEGIAVRPFTVNKEDLMGKLISWNCSGFFTDYPEKAVEIRKKKMNRD
ncbi:glycerophosphodiester phosphodiesterase [Metabacillus herbersteinensis]|uniref:Glycerophosphodiester phosphodiesterase n=1 Tax=Metabacillus herbersteinensis TaxID=283816 RepID=A0ABV6G8B5_9BACI